jgi:hypothetical protein
MQDPTFSNPASVQTMLKNSSPEQLSKLQNALFSKAEQLVGVIRNAEGTDNPARRIQADATADVVRSLLSGIDNIARALGNEKAGKKQRAKLLRMLPEQFQPAAQDVNNGAGLAKPATTGLEQ